jgi:two-component system, chemotaxis family, response regulator Rcp1
VPALPKRLLYVEDNPTDVFLVRKTLRENQIVVDLAVVEDGALALAYLRKEGKYREVTTPHLVLLDLNLPKKTGDEVLVAIKTDGKLKALPVVIFSSGADEQLCEPIYREYANSCIKKPLDLDGFSSAVQQICSYWFSLATLPD